MKYYPKKYEDFFQFPHPRCKIEDIEVFGGWSLKEYMDSLYKAAYDWQKGYFDFFVKYFWARRNFVWRGYKQIDGKSSYGVNLAWSVFLFNQVGHDIKLLYTIDLYRALRPYMDDLFTDFDAHNPFKEPEYFKFPFKYMNLDCLYFVHRIPERMELLKYGEENKMNLPQFYNYVLNYISCWNEENENGDKYTMYQGSRDGLKVNKKNTAVRFYPYCIWLIKSKSKKSKT